MTNKRYATRSAWKANYFEKLENAIRNNSKFLLVNADNVSSLQFAQIRASLRGKATVVMGKNTMMKKCIRGLLAEFPDYEKVLPLLVANVGFVFTNEDLKSIRDLVLENKVAAPARQGAISPVNVVVPAQNTGQGPEKTSFFQALSIQTKIARGTIEIVADVNLLKPGDKVGASEAALLNMLKISPFTYGLKVEQCFDEGSVFEPAVLDISEDDIRARFMSGVNNIAAVSLNIGYPTIASAPHSIANGLKKLIAVAAATDITFPAAEKTKAFLADPSAFVVEAAPAAAAAEAKVEEKKEESEEESDSDMGFDLFG
jgi:large subunit ribosomal protein LP0